MRNKPHYPYLFAPTTAILTATGDGSGVATLRIQASANTTVTISDNGNFYTDASGTTGESKTWSVEAGALRTIYLKVTSGTAKLTFAERRLVTNWGSNSSDGWTSAANAPSITFADSLQVALPNLVQLRTTGNSFFNGALPTDLTLLYLIGNNINWTYEGALPTGVTVLFLISTNINWTYEGALPTGLTYLYLNGNNINWTYEGALPTGLTYLDIIGNNINWTYFDVAGTGNISTFSLINFVTTPMTSTQLIALLTSMSGRTGNLPATCTIADYSADPSLAAITAADPVVDGTAAEQIKYWINTVKTNKSVTTISLNGTTY